MNDEMPIKYEAGYPGKDVMRNRAKNIMDEEMKLSGVRKPAPSSMSSPEKTKMRYYKKGGPVKCATGGALPPAKSPFESASKAMGESVPMKKGGKIKNPFSEIRAAHKTMKKAIGSPARQGAPGFAEGGGVRFADKFGDPETMKKGGKVMKMAMGGSGKIRHKEMTAAGKPINKKGSVRMK